MNAAAASGRLELIFRDRLLRLIMVRAAHLLIRIMTSEVMRGTEDVSITTVEGIATIIRIRSRGDVAQFRCNRRGDDIDLDAEIELRINVLDAGSFLRTFSNGILCSVRRLTSAVMTLTERALYVLINGMEARDIRRLIARRVLEDGRLRTFRLALVFSFSWIRGLLVFGRSCLFCIGSTAYGTRRYPVTTPYHDGNDMQCQMPCLQYKERST